MREALMTALVVTMRREWRVQWATCLLSEGCDVHTATDGLTAIDLLRKQIYDLVVIDDSLSDVSPLEFTLNLRELAARLPIYLIAGSAANNLSQLTRSCPTFFVGAPDAVLARLPAAVQDAQKRVSERGRIQSDRHS